MEFEPEETSHTVDKTGGKKGSRLLQDTKKGKDSAPKTLAASLASLWLDRTSPDAGKPRRLSQTPPGFMATQPSKGSRDENKPGASQRVPPYPRL